MKNYLLLIGLSVVLVIVWFHSGFLIGSGESGLPFYNIQGYIKFISHTWSEGAIGLPTSITLLSLLYFNVQSFAEYLSIPDVIIQSATFLVILLSAFISTYGFVYLLSKGNKSIALYSSLFYGFNQFVVFNIWGRLQYPFMFFYALVPVSLLLIYLGYSRKNIIYYLLLSLVTVVFSLSFTSLPLIELYWGLLLLFTFFLCITSTRKYQLTLWGGFILSIILWILFNWWWIDQFILTMRTSSYVLTQAYSANSDIQTFVDLSSHLGNLSYIFRGLHRDFARGIALAWGDVYGNPIIIFLMYLVPFLAFLPLLLKKKPAYLYFFLGLSLIIMYVMKGSVGPFGEVFLVLFTKIRLLEAFRNPFEKFGLIFSLMYAPLVGYGLYSLLTFKKIKNFLVTSAFILGLFVIPVFTIWNGWVFSSTKSATEKGRYDSYVSVPEYYKKANKWLQEYNTAVRVFSLPISDEGVTYMWNRGYRGVELSNGLFDLSFLSFCTGMQFLCPIVNNLEPLLLHYPQDFWKVMYPLNAQFVMTREDIDIQQRDLNVPSILENKLKTSENITREKTFGKLNFYSLENIDKLEKVFPTTSGIFYTSDVDTFISAIPIADYTPGDVYFTDPLKNNLTLPFTKQLVLHAKQIQKQNVVVNPETAVLELPYVKHLPGDRMYPIIRIKEKIQFELAGNNKNDLERTLFDKRLVETYQLVNQKKYDLAKRSFDEYAQMLSMKINAVQSLNSDLYRADLLRQKYVLEKIINTTKSDNQSAEEYEKAYCDLQNILLQLGMTTLYAVNADKYETYTVEVPEDWTYSIVLDTRRYKEFFSTPIIHIVVDGKIQEISVQPDQNYSILFSLKLKKGKHQIDIEKPVAHNLVSQAELSLSSVNTQEHSIPIRPFDPYFTYSISFSYTYSGNIPQIYVKENKVNGNSNDIHLLAGFSDKRDKTQQFTDHFSTNRLASSSAVVFNIWQTTCVQSDEKCRSDIQNDLEIQSLSVTRSDLGDLYLTASNKTEELPDPKISVQKINPARYEVSVEDAQTPYFLNFLESYHPLWKAYYLNGNKQEQVNDNNHILINNYANSWYIDKKGNYKMLIEFLPERSFERGKIISGIAIGLSIVFIIGYSIKKIIQRKRH